jgi:hypothetical protein
MRNRPSSPQPHLRPFLYDKIPRNGPRPLHLSVNRRSAQREALGIATKSLWDDLPFNLAERRDSRPASRFSRPRSKSLASSHAVGVSRACQVGRSSPQQALLQQRLSPAGAPKPERISGTSMPQDHWLQGFNFSVEEWDAKGLTDDLTAFGQRKVPRELQGVFIPW